MRKLQRRVRQREYPGIRLHINVRLAVIGKALKVQTQADAERNGKERCSDEPWPGFVASFAPFLQDAAKENVKRPDQGNDAPGGLVRNDRVGEQRSAGSDGYEAVAGIRRKDKSHTCQQSGQGGPFVASHEAYPVVIKGSDDRVGRLLVAPGLDSGLEPGAKRFVKPSHGLEIVECS